MIVPAAWQPGPLRGHPVVALTGDQPVPATLASAIAEAKRAGTGVLVLHLIPDDAPATDIDRCHHDITAIADRLAEPTVPVEIRVIRGDPPHELIHESVNAAAAVVGRPHRHGTTGWMRSLAHAVMKRTRCPLIVVPDS